MSSEAELYDAAVTVMMRLIFLVLRRGERSVADRRSRSTSSATRRRRCGSGLQAAADEYGEEVLESTHDGWPRLLATWRAVFGGVEHGDMVLAPYGGSLFDPDRYPFLEGRLPGSSWSTPTADPLPIDNRTVLHLLNALQTLDEGGQRRKLSFRALDVEQIGHVYEGMLDHTAARADGLGARVCPARAARNPEIELDELEAFEDDKALVDFLKERTGRSAGDVEEVDRPATSPTRRSTSSGRPGRQRSVVTRAAMARAERFAKLIRAGLDRGADGVPAGQCLRRRLVASWRDRHPLHAAVVDRGDRQAHPRSARLSSGPPRASPKTSGSSGRPTRSSISRSVTRPAGPGRSSSKPVAIWPRSSSKPAAFTATSTPTPPKTRSSKPAERSPNAASMASTSTRWRARWPSSRSGSITLAKDKPFTFVDHAIRTGDSLLGITTSTNWSTSMSTPTAAANPPRHLLQHSGRCASPYERCSGTTAADR